MINLLVDLFIYLLFKKYDTDHPGSNVFIPFEDMDDGMNYDPTTDHFANGNPQHFANDEFGE